MIYSFDPVGWSEASVGLTWCHLWRFQLGDQLGNGLYWACHPGDLNFPAHRISTRLVWASNSMTVSRQESKKECPKCVESRCHNRWKSLAPGAIRRHFCHILLVKANHTVSQIQGEEKEILPADEKSSKISLQKDLQAGRYGCSYLWSQSTIVFKVLLKGTKESIKLHLSFLSEWEQIIDW